MDYNVIALTVVVLIITVALAFSMLETKILKDNDRLYKKICDQNKILLEEHRLIARYLNTAIDIANKRRSEE